MADGAEMIVVLTTGKQDRGTRATLAFSWACASLAMGRPTTLYLTMDGTVWGMRGATCDVQVQGFEPLQEYLEQFFALDGKLLVCAPCSEYYCSFDRSVVTERLIPQAVVSGLSTVVGLMSGGTNVVTF